MATKVHVTRNRLKEKRELLRRDYTRLVGRREPQMRVEVDAVLTSAVITDRSGKWFCGWKTERIENERQVDVAVVTLDMSVRDEMKQRSRSENRTSA